MQIILKVYVSAVGCTNYKGSRILMIRYSIIMSIEYDE